MSIYHNYPPITTRDLIVAIQLEKHYSYSDFKSLLKRGIENLEGKYEEKIAFQAGITPPTTYSLKTFHTNFIWPESQMLKSSENLIKEFITVNKKNPSSGIGDASNMHTDYYIHYSPPSVYIWFNKIALVNKTGDTKEISISEKYIPGTDRKETLFNDEDGNQVYLFDNSKQRTSGGKKKSLRKKRRASRKARKNRTKRNK
jgi:hypothetical protein